MPKKSARWNKYKRWQSCFILLKSRASIEYNATGRTELRYKHEYRAGKIHLLTIENQKGSIANPLKQTELRAYCSYRIIGKEASVVINGGTGKIITAWKTKSKPAAKLSKDIE